MPVLTILIYFRGKDRVTVRPKKRTGSGITLFTRIGKYFVFIKGYHNRGCCRLSSLKKLQMHRFLVHLQYKNFQPNYKMLKLGIYPYIFRIDAVLLLNIHHDLNKHDSFPFRYS